MELFKCETMTGKLMISSDGVAFNMIWLEQRNISYSHAGLRNQTNPS